MCATIAACREFRRRLISQLPGVGIDYFILSLIQRLPISQLPSVGIGRLTFR
jgi:hypothetical protein